MSVLRDIMDVVWGGTSGVDAGASVTSEWRGAEDLNGCQFWISYTGASTINVSVECSAVPPTQARTRTRTNWSKVYTVKNGAAADEGFVNPPSPPMDRPFGSYRVVVANAGQSSITALRVAVCRHGLG